jgi:glycosyltransferase involved in cell wall biosynthesis
MTWSTGETVWVSWERHRRTRELCAAMNGSLREIVTQRQGVRKYAVLAAVTAWHLIRERPRVLFVQCPSVVLACWAIVLRPLVRYHLVVDLHNAAVRPAQDAGLLYRAVLRWIHRRSDLAVVTNARLREDVEAAGGQAIVLPDKLPRVGEAATEQQSDAVVFVCTFASDEPYTAVFAAAGLLPASIAIAVTGRPPANETEMIRLAPPNVRFTGFLPESSYLELLQGAAIVMDLTSREDCLVCGAYEAVALGKPLVTSDTKALRDYFCFGTVYVKHDPAAIAEGIRRALTDRAQLVSGMAALKHRLNDSWDREYAALRARLPRVVRGPAGMEPMVAFVDEDR